jgi:acetylornithine deacetylase
MTELMEAVGLSVEARPIDLDALRAHPAYTADIERDHALGVTGRWGQDSGPTLVLNGHIDVVPAGDEDRWTYPPWQATRAGDFVYGRGTADMKGALCCALAAIEALVQTGVSLPGAVELHSVVGEEDGGVGTLAAITHGLKADAAIVMEPTQLMVAPAQAGALSFRITVLGSAAHGALRTEGVDPIDKLIPLYRAVQAFEAQRNNVVDDPLFDAYDVPFALCIGTIRGGEWPSSVAESVVCEGRLGVGPHEDLPAVRTAFEQVIQETAETDPWLRQHLPVVEWWGAQFAPARIASDDPIVQTVSGAYEAVAHQPAVCRGMPYGADMRLLVNQADIPTVLFGPGDIRRAHAPDEHIAVEQLDAAAKIFALTILRYCGGSGSADTLRP